MRQKLLNSTFIAGGWLLAATGTGLAQTTWNDGGADQTWSNSANWSNGVPGSGTATHIGTQPTGDQIGIDTGSAIIASLEFDATLTAPSTILAFGLDTLTVNGNITNSDNNTHGFLLPITAGANGTWTGPLTFGSNTDIGTKQITLTGTSTFTGTFVNLDITNASTYGMFLGTGTPVVTGVTIAIGGAYTGVSGDTFDLLATGGFTGASFTLPSLTAGLAWDSSNFLTNGTLSVFTVPEPSAIGLMFAASAVMLGLRRTRPTPIA